MMIQRYVATHRIFTGVPVSRGYVYDRQTGRPVGGCPHRHRYGHARRAQACAERALRYFVCHGVLPTSWVVEREPAEGRTTP